MNFVAPQPVAKNGSLIEKLILKGTQAAITEQRRGESQGIRSAMPVRFSDGNSNQRRWPRWFCGDQIDEKESACHPSPNNCTGHHS
jgi:hypothetical protein